MGQSTWKRRRGKMWSKSSFAVLTFLFVSTSTAELWIEDRLHPDFNCQGNVTDAVCCMDHLCDHLSQSACQAGKPQNIFCQWDQKSEKCRPTKDDQGNVCCQSDPGDSACHDILINKKCPEGYEVEASCCQNTKWRGLETRNGYVCCNAPCKDLTLLEASLLKITAYQVPMFMDLKHMETITLTFTKRLTTLKSTRTTKLQKSLPTTLWR